MTCAARRKREMMPPRPNKLRRMRGVVLLALLLALALMGIGLLGAAEWWSTARQREAEAELLYVGDQYRKAIERYYYATPSPIKTFPVRLEDLVEDPRFPVPVHHLRKLYPDPVTGGAFEPVQAGDAIVGVASISDRQPIKRRNFPSPYGGFEDQESYKQWKFVFTPPMRGRAAPILPKLPQNLLANGVAP